MMKKGGIYLDSRLLDWGWSDKPEMVGLWVNILLRANSAEEKKHGIAVKRGQLLTTLRSLADFSGLSVQQTRTCLARLKSTHEITQESTHRYTIITVCNYDRYCGQKASGNTPGNTRPNTAATQHIDMPIHNHLDGKHIGQEHEKKKGTVNTTKENPLSSPFSSLPPTPPITSIPPIIPQENTHISARASASEDYLKFLEWIDTYAPEVAKMKKPFTEEQYRSIRQGYDPREVADVLEAMGNTAGLTKKYISAYLTCKSWLRLRAERRARQTGPAKTGQDQNVNDEWER